MTIDTPLHYVALAFLSEHEGAYLHSDLPLIERCASHLMERTLISQRAAEMATLQAYGELKGRNAKGYVDTSLTTSFAVFLRDSHTSTVHVFTVAELLDLVKTHCAATPATQL